MEIRALQANKAVNLIDEAIKLKSDAAGDYRNRKAIFDALAFGGIDQVIGKTPESLRVLKDYSTALGVNVHPIRDGKAIQSLDEKFHALSLAPMRADEVKKLSKGEVTNATLFTAKVTGDKPEEKGLFDQTTARAFRTKILERGGTADAMEMYKDFRGREPSVEPLLVKRGLK
jgi:hypothetical protein